MIYVDIKEKKPVVARGSLSEISAESVLILRQIFNKNVQNFGMEMAQNLMLNLLTKVVALGAAEHGEKEKEN